MEFNRIRVQSLQEFVMILVPHSTTKGFTTLVSRGINTWDQAPQEIKDFADELSGNSKLLKNTPQS